MASQPFYGISGHVTVTVAPENIPKFLELLRAAFEKVAAEPELTFFELYQSADEPGVFRWVEAWSKDMKWLLEVTLSSSFLLIM
jgi:quinol monooxygenase YgiN